MKNTLGKRKEQAAETKNKIYKSAEYLFTKRGFDDVNVNDIVKQAGVAKGSFYVHFESKDSLIAILINDYVKRVDLDYKAYLETLPDEMPMGDILLSLVGKIADVITDTVGYESIKNLYKIHITKDIETHAMVDYSRELYGMFCDVINKGMEQHVFQSDFPVEDIARHFVAAFRGLTFEWCIRYPDQDLKEQALKHFKLLLAGINAPPNS